MNNFYATRQREKVSRMKSSPHQTILNCSCLNSKYVHPTIQQCSNYIDTKELIFNKLVAYDKQKQFQKRKLVITQFDCQGNQVCTQNSSCLTSEPIFTTTTTTSNDFQYQEQQQFINLVNQKNSLPQLMINSRSSNSNNDNSNKFSSQNKNSQSKNSFWYNQESEKQNQFLHHQLTQTSGIRTQIQSSQQSTKYQFTQGKLSRLGKDNDTNSSQDLEKQQQHQQLQQADLSEDKKSISSNSDIIEMLLRGDFSSQESDTKKPIEIPPLQQKSRSLQQESYKFSEKFPYNTVKEAVHSQIDQSKLSPSTNSQSTRNQSSSKKSLINKKLKIIDDDDNDDDENDNVVGNLHNTNNSNRNGTSSNEICISNHILGQLSAVKQKTNEKQDNLKKIPKRNNDQNNDNEIKRNSQNQCKQMLRAISQHNSQQLQQLSQTSNKKSSSNRYRRLRKLVQIKRNKNEKSEWDLSEKGNCQHENICAICFSKPEDNVFGILECFHKFCFQCIRDWADVTNQCPLCRQSFLYILKKNIGDANNKEEKIQVEEKKQRVHQYSQDGGDGELDDFVVEDENAMDETCYICGGADNQMELLVCDECDFHICHVYCDSNIKNGKIPDGNWYCHFCRGELFDDEEENGGGDGDNDKEKNQEEEEKNNQRQENNQKTDKQNQLSKFNNNKKIIIQNNLNKKKIIDSDFDDDDFDDNALCS